MHKDLEHFRKLISRKPKIKFLEREIELNVPEVQDALEFTLLWKDAFEANKKEELKVAILKMARMILPEEIFGEADDSELLKMIQLEGQNSDFWNEGLRLCVGSEAEDFLESQESME